MESNTIKWEDKIKFLGMHWNLVKMSTEAIKVKVFIPGGAFAEGQGQNLEEALRSAAYGLPFDWFSVEKIMTEHNWKSMSHL